MLLTLGWRNLWRNKRRSLFTIGAIALATLLTVAFEGLVIGTWDYNVSQSVEMLSGYLQIQRSGFQDSPSLHKSFAFPGEVAACIRDIPRITGYAPRIQADGLVSFHGKSAGTALLGVDPQAEVQMSRLQDRVREGRMIRQDGIDEVVVGATLLSTLQAAVGDTIVLLAQGYDGVMGNQKFRVAGSMKIGSPDIDAAMILLHYRAAQELLAMNGLVNVVVIGAEGLQSVEAVHTAMHASLVRRGLEHLAVLTWSEVIPELKQEMDFDRITDSMFMAVLVIVVAFGVTNTILMSVTERFREFGVTLALGMKSSGLVTLVFLETVSMALVGIAAGCVAGYCANVYLALNPILLGGDVGQIYEAYGFVPMIRSSMRLSVPLFSAGLILLLCCIAGLYPLYRVANLEPLKGIRHT